MSILTCEATIVKSYSEQLAELDGELKTAQTANDPTRWLAAWDAREELQIARFLAESPVARDDDPDPSESEPVDWPSELDRLYNAWYALGYDCVDAVPAADMDTLRLWIARLAYERGWARGMADRYTWIDELEWNRMESEEAEVRSAIGHPSWEWDANDVAGRDA